MKRFCHVFLFSFLFVVLLSVGVFADSPTSFIDVRAVDIIDSEASSQVQDVSVSLKASPVTPSTSNGFHKVVIQLLGNYEPITVDYTYRQGSSSYESHSINTAPDWSWICSCAIFGLVIFCVFRLIGGLLSRG